MSKTSMIVSDNVRLLKQKYLDKNQHVVQADGDGGDSLNRLGCVDSCIYFLRNKKLYFNGSFLLNALPFNSKIPGRFCRNPDESRWYSNPNNVTRDQMLPLESALAIGGLTQLARTHAALRAKRWFFHFSEENDGKDAGPTVRKLPDPPSPSELGLLIRACDNKSLKAALWFFDLFLLFDVLVTRKLTDRNRYDMDNQLLPVVLASVSVMPTWISKLSARIYSKTDADQRLLAYHAEGPGKNGIEPLGKIMAETFKTLKEATW